MKKVYGDDCMSRTQVYTWFTRFKNGREDLNDDSRPGRPEASNRAELVEKVSEIITIFTEDLGKRKVFARFVRHQLNAPPHKTIQSSVTQVLKNIPKTEFKKSMDKLFDRSKRCIESNGTYFE